MGQKMHGQRAAGMTERARLLLFVLVGGGAALVNVLSRIVIDTATSYEMAIILAYMIGMTVAFSLNRALVFEARAASWKGQYLRFGLVNAVSALQVLAVSLLFSKIIFPAAGVRYHPEMLAHIIGVVSPVLTSYYLHKHFTFRRQAEGS